MFSLFVQHKDSHYRDPLNDILLQYHSMNKSRISIAWPSQSGMLIAEGKPNCTREAGLWGWDINSLRLKGHYSGFVIAGHYINYNSGMPEATELE